MSLMNSLSAAGSGIAAFAGAAGLEAQKADLAQQSLRLADQLTTVRESAGRQEAGQIAAAAADKQQTFQAGQSDLDRQNRVTTTGMTVNAPTPEMKNAATATSPNTPPDQAALIRANLLPKEAQLAEYMKGAPPEIQEAMNGILMGRPRYSFQPTTMPDPDNPGKFVSGVNKQDTRTGDITFVPTGTDPNKPGAGGLGNRAEVYFKRVTSAATLAAEAAKNIMELPAGSSSGIFVGRQQGGGLMAAAKESLVNAMTSQQVQDYNVMVSGISRNLASIEASGLAPNAGFTKSMDSVVLKEGDSELTKMRKMAEIRQIVEMGMQPNLDDPKIPEVQKQGVRDVIAKIQNAIPFTHHDITELQKSKDPKMTMAGLVASRGIGPGTAPSGGAMTPGPAVIRYDADGNRIAQ